MRQLVGVRVASRDLRSGSSGFFLSISELKIALTLTASRPPPLHLRAKPGADGLLPTDALLPRKLAGYPNETDMLAILIVSSLPLYVLYVVYEYLNSPLRNIPAAHPTTPFSSLWILSRTLMGRRNHSIHAAHLKHGSIIRLGPSEISINDPALVKTVYSAGNGFDKPAWYHIFTNYGFESHPFLLTP